MRGGTTTKKKKETPSRRHFNEANSAFIQISYFYPPFLICVLYIYIIHKYIWCLAAGRQPGLPAGEFLSAWVVALPLLELTTRPPHTPVTINFGFCIFL